MMGLVDSVKTLVASKTEYNRKLLNMMLRPGAEAHVNCRLTGFLLSGILYHVILIHFMLSKFGGYGNK